AMPFSHLPAQLSAWFVALTGVLDKRSAPRLALLLQGALFATGRRTVTSWLRAAGITLDFRRAYNALFAAGRRSGSIAVLLLLRALTPFSRLVGPARLPSAIAAPPPNRYGPAIQGAGFPHTPPPGPAGAKHCYGHLWVTLAWLACHPLFG